jgi:heme/copper-type cytochrome/quinol oxidase subunit 3
LIVVFVRAHRDYFSRQKYTGVQVCAMYWTFVVALWPILYGLVYLY